MLHLIVYIFLVSGEANFTMSLTRLTIGGFTQPGVARNLIEIPPKPLYGNFASLENVDKAFSSKIGIAGG